MSNQKSTHSVKNQESYTYKSPYSTNHHTNETYYYHRAPQGHFRRLCSGHHQGSIIALTNKEGQTVESIIYDGHYGTVLNHHKTIDTLNPYGYTGREMDTPELYYYRARYYDPTMQRFLNLDPIKLQSGDFNFYRYVGNDPVNFRDPTGLDQEILIGGPYGDHAYGHAALRVFGKGYDKIYDFGRYGKTYGLLGSEGEGVLRIWNNKDQYILGENATGRITTGYVNKTTEEQDKIAMDYYNSLLPESCKKDPRGRDMESCVLDNNYHALKNNCTTMTTDGVNKSNSILGSKITDSKESKGRGLGFFEKQAAGDAVGSKIFMPADLQKNIENTGEHYETNLYKKNKKD